MSSLDELTALISSYQQAFTDALGAADAAAASARPAAFDALKVAWTGRKSGKTAHPGESL